MGNSEGHDTNERMRTRGAPDSGVFPCLCLAVALSTLVAMPSTAQTVDVDRAAPPNAASSSSRPLAPDFSGDVDARKRYGIAALEIVGFDVALNQVNRRWSSSSDYDSNLSTIRRNLRSGWGVDHDPFDVNQFAHPYQGSVYHTIARSSGLSYWEASAYTFAGSIFWEIAGEKTRPSGNDQVASGVGGSFLGEALFRMANLVLENGRGPRVVREGGAALISPATGFNRLAFGDDRTPIFSSHNADYYSRAQLGASRSSEDDAGLSNTATKRNELVAEFAIDYGMPGKPGYEYSRPFDYFAFQGSVSSANGLENVITRGSLFVRPYAFGPRYRGIVGVYGTYDYISPQTFRVSSTGLSLGTTGEWKASDVVAVQGSALLGAGYAAVGTVRSSDPLDYHYGVAPQGLLALRVIYANRLSFDVTGREYFVSRVAAADRGGHENIARLDASLTYRVSGPHAVSVKYLGNRRDVSYPDIGSRSQTRATIGLYYTYLGEDLFAGVKF